MTSPSNTPMLTPAGREENVRIGPVSVFALTIIICLAVLAVLTLSTANASFVMTQRLATATSEMYLDETAAQTFLAELDNTLAAKAPSSSTSATMNAIEDNLVAMRDKAAAATDKQVDIVASVINQQVNAEFSCKNGRVLKVAVTIMPDGSYRIDKWKVSAVVNEEQPMGNLFTGA